MPNQADLIAGGLLPTKTGAALVTNLAIAKQSVLYGFDGRNTSAGTRFIWCCDATAVANITATTAVHVIEVLAGQNFSYTTGTFGELFKSGIVVAASTTDFPTFTVEGVASQFITIESAPEYGTY